MARVAHTYFQYPICLSWDFVFDLSPENCNSANGLPGCACTSTNTFQTFEPGDSHDIASLKEMLWLGPGGC
jgi:hypothetical protein